MNRHRLLMLALVLMTSGGCDEPVTEVVVTVEAESTFASAPTDLRITVRGAAHDADEFEPPSREVTLAVGPGRTYAFPVDVTVSPRGGDASRRWQVDAIATTTDRMHSVTVRVRGSYVDGRTTRVSLLLEDACDGVVCGDALTCVAGVCAAIPGDTSTGPMLSPKHCALHLVREPSSTDHSLDANGVAPVYPAVETCPANHDPGDACSSATQPDDLCFSERAGRGAAFCRIPCTPSPTGVGSIEDDPRCQQFHPDSHCVATVGLESEPDRSLCTIPCNPIDDVGCPDGLHCLSYVNTDGSTMATNCVELEPDPGHQGEPCSIVDEMPYPDLYGCDVGYLCGYDSVCGEVGNDGAVCVQLCDLDDADPRVACPSGTECVEFPSYDDALGPIRVGRCLTE